MGKEMVKCLSAVATPAYLPLRLCSEAAYLPPCNCVMKRHANPLAACVDSGENKMYTTGQVSEDVSGERQGQDSKTQLSRSESGSRASDGGDPSVVSARVVLSGTLCVSAPADQLPTKDFKIRASSVIVAADAVSAKLGWSHNHLTRRKAQ